MKKTKRSGFDKPTCDRLGRESGVALIIALLALLIMSTLAAGLMFSTQSEIWTNANYRTVTQARYAAEAGAQQAAYWISQTWAAPTSTMPSVLNNANFKLNNFPLLYGTSPVVLNPGSPSAVPGISDTFGSIDSATESSFQSKVENITSPFTAANINGSFAIAAQLLSAKWHADVTNCNGTTCTGGWETSWKIISQGTVGSGARQSKVQVIETVENKYIPNSSSGTTTVPAFNFGAFANSTACGAITMSGSSTTYSYNSQGSGNPGNSNPTTTNAYGDVATLGNLNLGGSANVYGNVFAPGYNVGDPNAKNGSTSTYYPYGVSGGPTWPYWNSNNATPEACSSTMKYAVNEDNSGSKIGCNGSSCTQKASQLPTAFTNPYPTAAIPDSNVPTNTSVCNYDPNSVCNGGSGGGSGNPGTTAANPLVLPPSNSFNPPKNYGKVNFAANTYIQLNSGVYYFDTLTVGGSTHISIGTPPVQIYILNGSGSTTPINFTGGSGTNVGGDPNNLSIIYNGNQTVNVGSISSNRVFATIYAPNANVSFNGNGMIYGAVIGNTVSITSGGHIIYDTNLKNETPHIYQTNVPSGSLSAYHVDEFSWSAF